MSRLESDHHVVNFFHMMGGFSIYKTDQRIWLSTLSIALEKELKVLDFVYWVNCYCFVLFDCFPLLLYFFTSLIKLILCLKFFYRQKADGGHGRGGWTIRSCSISLPHRPHNAPTCFIWPQALWMIHYNTSFSLSRCFFLLRLTWIWFPNQCPALRPQYLYSLLIKWGWRENLFCSVIVNIKW